VTTNASAKTELEQARALFQQKDFAAAIDILQSILNNKPKTFDACYLLAVNFEASGDLLLAETTFLKALAIDNSSGITFHSLANVQKRLGKVAEADKNFQKAISTVNPSALYFFDYGVFLGEQGKLKQALDAHLQVLEIDSSQSEVYLYIFKHFMCLHRYQDAIEIADIGLLCQNLDDFQLYELLISKAILFWLFDNIEEAVQAIVLSEGINTLEEGHANLKTMKVFHGYIKRLLVYRQQHSEVYQDTQASDLPLIYFISESHGFAPNGMTVNYQQQSHLIKSLFISGTKMVHLIQQSSNQYNVSLTTLLRGLPEQSSVVLGFGEIDCRPDEGIFKHCKQQGIDFHKVVDGMVEKYIALLTAQANKYKLNIMVYGIPAPHPIMVNMLAQEQQAEFKQMIAYLNQQLAIFCKKEQLVFLDVYTLTNVEGISNLKYHSDSSHVNPSTVPELFELIAANSDQLIH